MPSTGFAIGGAPLALGEVDPARRAPHPTRVDPLLRECLVVPRSGQPPLPGMRRISRPGWEQLITPSFRHGGLNEVSLAVLSEEEADAVIDRTIAEYRALGLGFRGTVGPDSRPLDLGARLLARGSAPGLRDGSAAARARCPRSPSA